MVDAFAIEKLHLRVRPVADRTDNTSQFERTVLGGVLNYQISQLKSLKSDARLLGKSHQSLPEYPSAKLSNSVLVHSMELFVGDIVLHAGTDAGAIVACAEEDGELLVIANGLALVETISQHSAIVVADGSRCVWRADDTLRQALHVQSLKLPFPFPVQHNDCLQACVHDVDRCRCGCHNCMFTCMCMCMCAFKCACKISGPLTCFTRHLHGESLQMAAFALFTCD